jgi:hypothetical protein
MKCEQCGLPVDYEVHRAHADPIFIAARRVGWEDEFMIVEGAEATEAGNFDIRDAECELVCSVKSKEAAALIADALNEYWAEHKL